jgi:hypothetical protein
VLDAIFTQNFPLGAVKNKVFAVVPTNVIFAGYKI